MINLHAIAGPAAACLHPSEEAVLWQSAGQELERGRITPKYAAPLEVQVQIQSLSADELAQQEEASRTQLTRRAYLCVPKGGLTPAGIIRPLVRSGDILRRADGTCWLITSLAEDFSASGWVRANITQQIEPPEGFFAEAAETDGSTPGAGVKDE